MCAPKRRALRLLMEGVRRSGAHSGCLWRECAEAARTQAAYGGSAPKRRALRLLMDGVRRSGAHSGCLWMVSAEAALTQVVLMYYDVVFEGFG